MLEWVFSFASRYPVRFLPSCIPSCMSLWGFQTPASSILAIFFIIPNAQTSIFFSIHRWPSELFAISSPFRCGAPRAHWPELTPAHSSHRAQQYRNFPPTLGISYINFKSISPSSNWSISPPPAWRTGTKLPELWASFGRLLKTGNTGSYLSPKRNKQPAEGMLLLMHSSYFELHTVRENGQLQSAEGDSRPNIEMSRDTWSEWKLVHKGGCIWKDLLHHRSPSCHHAFMRSCLAVLGTHQGHQQHQSPDILARIVTLDPPALHFVNPGIVQVQ